MKTLIVYGTLSGSTMTAATLVGDTIRVAGHEVTVVTADPSVTEQVKTSDAIVFASPSWEDQGKDGQPLPEVRQVLESLTAADLTGKRIAVCGLGDISYPHFCGAVDVLESLLKDRGVAPIVPSLRIDRYYSSPDNEAKVKAWADSVAASLKG